MKLIFDKNKKGKHLGKVKEGKVIITNVPMNDDAIEIRDGMMIEHFVKKNIKDTTVTRFIDFTDIAKKYEGLNSLEIMELYKDL